MEEDEGGGLRKKKIGEGEVDFKEKAGTAWSHNFLNQKPWHPLSYPNQRRKWIAEQTDAQRQRRKDEVAREFAQEQEFFRQTALISKKEKEKVEIMKAVSFMYVRPPGYNAESAKAAELEDERRRSEGSCPPQSSTDGVTAPSSIPPEEKKKPRPKDVFGRALPTEEEFDVLKNAPRMETGLPARVKPFGIEVRNVKCLRCGNYGHQSGDRECPLKDAIMPNEENRLKRDDPLTSIIAHADSSEPLKWELKQKPGISPPRGGFKPDDPNQQIVAEDIFDEYGGFLDGGIIPDLLTNFSAKKSRKHSKSKAKSRGELSANAKVHKSGLSPSDADSDGEKSSKKRKMKEKRKKRQHSDSSDNSDMRRHHQGSEHRLSVRTSSSDSEADRRRSKNPCHSNPLNGSDHEKPHERYKPRHSDSLDGSDLEKPHERYKPRRSDSLDGSDREKPHKRDKPHHSIISDNAEIDRHHEGKKDWRSVAPDDSYYDRHHKRNKDRRSFSPEDSKEIKRSKKRRSVSPDDLHYDRHQKRNKDRRSFSPDDSDHDRHHKRSKQRHSVFPDEFNSDKRHKKSKHRRSATPDDSYDGWHHKRNRLPVSPDGSNHVRHHKRSKHQTSATSDDSENDKRHKRNKHRRHLHHHHPS
ncbi:hypothetical protein AQUCO_01300875v1 [Aquilegia coerulea]|uniref:CBF1-interacting co-repressor CIR N-terminal domain-containing protein n=1 Tax=Aquilegia coerulea TaxID=218851 RepID=A0A2G5E3R5_AQUCA|nr:hypothetical protein AQUCO_01300875v1 [Aquilegia coerulea]